MFTTTQQTRPGQVTPVRAQPNQMNKRIIGLSSDVFIIGGETKNGLLNGTSID